MKDDAGREWFDPLVVGYPVKRLIGEKEPLPGTKNKRRRLKIFRRDGNKCLKCGTTNNLTLDHIKPKAHGGTSRKSNLQTLCFKCNNKKADTEVDYRK